MMFKNDQKKKILLLLILILFFWSLFIFINKTNKSIQSNGLRSSKANASEYFQLDDKTYKLPPTTTTTLLTTTTLPQTTTTRPYSSPASTVIVDKAGINWEAIAICESSLGTGSPQWGIDTGNGYYGGLQFSHDTWIAYGGGQYSYNANLTSRENQIKVASGMSLTHWPVCGKRG